MSANWILYVPIITSFCRSTYNYESNSTAFTSVKVSKFKIPEQLNIIKVITKTTYHIIHD